MTQPWSSQYDNEFEKQLYMAINIFRHNPKRWVPIINEVCRKQPNLNNSQVQKDLVA